MDDFSNMILFFNIFKETAINNIGIIRGFPNWVVKMDYIIQGDELLIKIPAVLINKGTPDIISHSKRKKEIDQIMRKKNYTYIEVVIRLAMDRFTNMNQKHVTSMIRRTQE